MDQNKDMSFEKALAELQDVVDKLEAGKVPLEMALSLYERGMELVKVCNSQLDTAEQRVNAVYMENGEAVLRSFGTEGLQ